MSGEQTYWNAEPAPAIRGTAIVAHAPRFRQYWAQSLIGTRIAVVQVTYAGAVQYLDNRDGHGWAKVTEGHGSPRYAHANVSVEADSFQFETPGEQVRRVITESRQAKQHHPGELIASMTETQRSVVEDLISTAMAAGAACIAERGRKGLVDMNASLSDALGDYPMEFVSIRPSLLANVLEAFQ